MASRSSSRSAARRGRRSGAEVRELLISSAADEFRSREFGEVTIRDVAERAGVSTSVLYRNFPTKERLFCEAVVRPFVEFVSGFKPWFESIFSQPDIEIDLARRFIADLYEALHDHQGVLKVLFGAEREPVREGTPDVHSMLDGIFSEMSAMGQRTVAAHGWAKQAEMDLTIRTIVSLVSGTVAFGGLYLPPGASGSDDRVIDHLARFVVYGFRLRPGEESV